MRIEHGDADRPRFVRALFAVQISDRLPAQRKRGRTKGRRATAGYRPSPLLRLRLEDAFAVAGASAPNVDARVESKLAGQTHSREMFLVPTAHSLEPSHVAIDASQTIAIVKYMRRRRDRS